MMQRLRAFVVTCAVALVALAAAAQPVTVTDDRGTTVRLAQPPQRIVSLLPSLTETVCELGACARLVGVDRYSNWPTSAARLPRLGGLDDANVEGIVALKPDVVLLARSARIIQRLESLGVPVVALEPDNMPDVQRVLRTVGQLLAVDDADRVWRGIDAGIRAAAQSLPPGVRRTRVYFEVSSVPYAAGESSFIGQVLARLGAQNVVPAALGPFPKLNPEFVVRANPDVIMVSDRTSTALEARPGWAGIRAVRERRVCRFTPDEGDVLVRPGPRMAEGARLMARCLQPVAR